MFKSADTDAKSNALYIHVLAPAVPGVDYRPSLWLDKLLGGAPPELLAKYRDAFAGAPSKLGLVELAHMSVTPVPKPANASPTSAAAAAEAGQRFVTLEPHRRSQLKLGGTRTVHIVASGFSRRPEPRYRIS